MFTKITVLHVGTGFASEKMTWCHSRIQLYRSAHQNHHLNAEMSSGDKVMVAVMSVHTATIIVTPEGKVSFEDAKRSGRSQTSHTTENIEKGFCGGTIEQPTNKDGVKIKISVLPHPTYYTDLASCDFRRFLELENLALLGSPIPIC
ncbi:hypothetical protein TNCV_2027731 [Trichonephila clavipes]|nr:hypothetical protein TNCV_2027731 [Trichonephila clavipes]